jgi:hypothetical protein
MDFKLEISTDNNTFYSVDLFSDSELEYSIDFYDNLNVDSVKLPFFTTLKIPLTDLNKTANRFGYDPFTSDKDDFPKGDYFFKLTTFGSTNTVIRGMLNVTAIEYNSNEPYIDVKLVDFISKFINDLKDVSLSTLYDSTNAAYQTYYNADNTFDTFKDTVATGGEAGTLNTNPSYTRPIIFPYIDFCGDLDKFGYGARQFTEYGAGMDRTGFVPVFSVKLFLEYLGRYLTDSGFETRVDSALFGLNITEAIPDFEAEKLHMLIPSKLEAKQTVNTREFEINQMPYCAGVNEDMFTDFKRDDPTVGKLMATNYFYGAETHGNYNTAGEFTAGALTDYGVHIRRYYYPSDPSTATSNSFSAGDQGYFTPHMSFNAAITFDSGSLNATINDLTLDIPLIQDDKMVQSIDPSASNMKFNMFLGVYEDGFPIKKIRLEDVTGDPIELNASDASAIQGDSEKTETNVQPGHHYFDNTNIQNNRFVILDPSPQNDLQTGYTDALQWNQEITVYIPSGEELLINGESRYSTNYFLEPVSGTLSITRVTNVSVHDQHTSYGDTVVTADAAEGELRKTITGTNDYENLNLTFKANQDYNLYFDDDVYNVKSSLENTATLKPFDVLLAICKRFNCGLFYEFDSVTNENILRVDPIKYARSGTENINQYIDDLKSVKLSIGGDKFKNITLNNKDFGHFYDKENQDGLTTGSTTQEINPEGISDLVINLKSGVLYRSIAGDYLGNQVSENVNSGGVSSREISFTNNVFTRHQDIGLKFAYVDKPLFTTYIKRPQSITSYQRQLLETQTQRIYPIGVQHVFNGRLFNKNTQNWDLLAEDTSGNTTDYYDFYVDDEKIKHSDSPSIEFDMVIPTSELADLEFLLKEFTASRITSDTIVIKSVDGEVYEDNAYLTVKGILK